MTPEEKDAEIKRLTKQMLTMLSDELNNPDRRSEQ